MHLISINFTHTLHNVTRVDAFAFDERNLSREWPLKRKHATKLKKKREGPDLQSVPSKNAKNHYQKVRYYTFAYSV